MKFVVTNEQMKSAERLCDEKYISFSQMMKNAGNAAGERVLALCTEKAAAAVLCGSGNNGGDGFVIARKLLENGVDTRVILANGAPKTEISREYFSLLPREIVLDYNTDKARCNAVLREGGIAVDCVFGTGFHGALPENIAELMTTANSVPIKVAVDVPTGVNSDTGESDEHCFKPDFTLVLAAMKRGLINPACVDLLGKIELLDIGISEDCYEDFSAKITDESAYSAIPKRKPSANKGTFGRLLNIAGSLCYSGAAAMSTKAALRTGAGLCTLAAPISVVKMLGAALHETTYLPLPETDDGFVAENCTEKIAEMLPKMNAVCVGCGLGNSENTRILTEFVVKNAECPIILDADGINSLGGNINVLKERTSAGRATVLTPHPLEFSRISGLSVAEIQRDRIKAAHGFSEETGAVVLLKGAFTVIAHESEVFVNPTGCAALAKGGSGDVLAGIIASLLAQGVEPLKAAASAAFIHGKAAENLAGKIPAHAVLATDLIDGLYRF
ncbi:MAG: NAD(P)H-hydrate dehydratase [Oscillospiraceae bacterium]|nr:NAD(P)H-hydrate dehydratase [Oscillospiraceae bacterium]